MGAMEGYTCRPTLYIQFDGLDLYYFEQYLNSTIVVNQVFTLLSISGKLANFTLATLVSLHYNIYKDRVKLATFKISYLN